MARADFSTRIDVQPPNPALLAPVSGTVSERFAGGLSNYRDQLERSLNQLPSTATAQRTTRRTTRRTTQRTTQRTTRYQPAGSRQQSVSAPGTSTTVSTRRTVDSHRSAAQPAAQTRHHRPAPQTTASATAEPAPRPAATSERPSPPKSRPRPKDDKSPAPDAKAKSTTAGSATQKTPTVETPPAETAVQKTTPSEAAPAEGTPPVNLQLFTNAEVDAASRLAAGGLPAKEGVPGSSSQSDKKSGTATDRKPNASPDANVLVPPLGIFVEPNPAEAATINSGQSDTTANSPDQAGTSADNTSSTNGLSVTVDNFPPGQAPPPDETPIPQQLVSMPNSTETSIRKVPTDTIQQPPTTAGSQRDDVSAADKTNNASGQTAGTPLLDSPSTGTAPSTPDGNGASGPGNLVTVAGQSADSSGTGRLREKAVAKTQQHSNDRLKPARQTTGAANAGAVKPPGPTLQIGPANPAVAAVNSPPATGTPTASKAETPLTASLPIDAGGSTTGSPRIPVTHPGDITASPNEIGQTQAASGPREGQRAELVDRVAAAVRSAHQSQRNLRIRLTPPELGTVRIEISSRNGALTARLEVETTAAQQTIQHNLPLLRDTLAQQGTHLQQIDVHLTPNRGEEGQSHSGGQQQSDPQQQQQRQQQQQQPRQQQPRPGSQKPQRAENDESVSRSNSYRSLDELDIQV